MGPLEYGLSAVHWSWFLVPHGTLAYILLRHREHYQRSAVLMAACFDLGCVVYWLVPTAPPWWAGANGNMPPVRRIMAEAGERFWRRLWHPLYHSLQGNPFAAMPSLHFGTSVMAARILSQVGPRQAALGWAYALTLGFGLVYLGEHYVIDLLAGLALAEGIWRAGAAGGAVLRAIAGGRSAAGAAGRLMRTEERRLRARGRRDLRDEELDSSRIRGGRASDDESVGAFQALLQDRRKLLGGVAVVVLLVVRDLRRLPEAGRSRRRGPQARRRGLVLDRHRDRLQRARVRRLRRAVPRHPRRHARRRRSSRRLDLKASYQITMAGLAATRIFSAAGAGGIVLTYWALRKAGMPRRRAACRMVALPGPPVRRLPDRADRLRDPAAHPRPARRRARSAARSCRRRSRRS